MANLMGVTNPVPGYDGPNNTRVQPTAIRPGDTSIQNIPDPTRVGRPDARTDQNGANDALLSDGLRYDSNLQMFLQALRESPDLAAEFTKMVSWLNVMAATPGLTEGVATEMKAFLQMLHMDAQGLHELFSTQMKAGNRFAGPLMSLLRQTFQSTNSPAIRQDILLFLKRYSDFSSSDHIGRTMNQLLRQLPDYMPKSWGEALANYSARLQLGLQAGDRQGNLKLLQGEVIPHLADYVERTHDMGTARTLISMLILNVTRYENGDEESMLQAFRQLSRCGESLAGLNQLDDKALLKLLRENDFTKAARADAFSERLASLASRALRGDGGTDLRETFTEIVRAMLINESVYMPLRHGLIPLLWQDRVMYSEYWVDPDAENESGRREEDGKIQFLFKMDIQGLGFVEMVPGKGSFVASKEEASEKEITRWFAENEVEVMDVIQVRSVIEPLAVKLAVNHAADQDKEALKEIHQQTLAAVEAGDFIKLGKCDEAFHALIMECSKNKMLISINRQITDYLKNFRGRTFRIPNNVQNIVPAHSNILKAFLDGDAERAEACMEKHMEQIMIDLESSKDYENIS